MKFTPAESYWHFNCRIAVADFFRGLRFLAQGDFVSADLNLHVADMTDVPFNLEGLDDAQTDMQLAKCL